MLESATIGDEGPFVYVMHLVSGKSQRKEVFGFHRGFHHDSTLAELEILPFSLWQGVPKLG